jgi:Protein O-mannosyl-transferase TMEM260-like
VTRSTRLVPALLVALLAFGAGLMAMLPGVQFWDTGELQAVGPLMGTAHPTGFPTYVLLGWLASVLLQPFGEPAFRMNLFSAICLAVAAGVTVDLVRALTGWVVLGVAAGIAMALTPIAWAIATHADAHSLHLALVAILLWLLVAWDARVRAPERPEVDPAVRIDRVDRGDRYLIAAAFVFGLAVGNHSLTLLLAIPVALYVLAVDPAILRRGRLVLPCVGVLALTLVVVYLELPLRAGPFRAALVYGTPNTWEGFKYIVLAEQFQGSLSDPFGELPRKFGELITRTVAQFGIFAPLIPIAFLVTALRRPRYALLTGSAAAITCFFAASYVNADINRYYLGPALMAWTWLAILAAALIEALTAAGDPFPDATLDDPAPGERAATMLRTRTSLTALIIAVALLVPTVVAAPARYSTLDLRGEHAAASWTDHVLKVMAPDAVIVSWWSYSTPLWYEQRVEGRRPDIAIIDDRTRLDENLGGLTDVIDANLKKGRPVYVIRLDRSEVALLAQRYDLDYIDGSDASALTRVLGPRTAGG